jgi:hypothetical protein
MSLPIFLPYNLVSIYGIGSEIGLSGITQPPGYLWGNVDAISQYGIEWAEPGDSVLFKNQDVQCRLAYPTDNTSYTLIAEVKLVCREYPAL